MKCRKCFSSDVRVLDTRTDEDDVIRRRHECQECEHRFYSLELPPEAVASVAGRVRRWRLNKVTDHKLQRRLARVRLAAAVAEVAGQAHSAREAKVLSIKAIADKHKLGLNSLYKAWSAEPARVKQAVTERQDEDLRWLTRKQYCSRYGITDGGWRLLRKRRGLD